MSARALRHHPSAGPAPDLFARLCAATGLPAPVAEYRFHPTRRWRIDYAWPDQRVGLEVDGGIVHGGRHTHITGWRRDTEKLNTAAVLGWRMLRCLPDTLVSTDTLALVRAALLPAPDSHG